MQNGYHWPLSRVARDKTVGAGVHRVFIELRHWWHLNQQSVHTPRPNVYQVAFLTEQFVARGTLYELLWQRRLHNSVVAAMVDPDVHVSGRHRSLKHHQLPVDCELKEGYKLSSGQTYWAANLSMPNTRVTSLPPSTEALVAGLTHPVEWLSVRRNGHWAIQLTCAHLLTLG